MVLILIKKIKSKIVANGDLTISKNNFMDKIMCYYIIIPYMIYKVIRSSNLYVYVYI